MENIQTYYTPSDFKKRTKNNRPSEIQNLLECKIRNRNFPCVGAKRAINSGAYRLGIYGSMDNIASAEQFASDLKTYIRETLDTDSDYMTMVAVFDNKIESEVNFENLLWKQLSLLKSMDPKKEESIAGISDNPKDVNYSFTFNGEAFYIVGMHDLASRKARRFPYPSMAFNLHKQFVKLKENDKFDKMREVIRKRDIAFQGTINPMLSNFGDGLEAPQYSGRNVSKSWQCPFHK